MCRDLTRCLDIFGNWSNIEVFKGKRWRYWNRNFYENNAYECRMASRHPSLSAEKNHNDLYHVRVKRDKEDFAKVTQASKAKNRFTCSYKLIYLGYVLREDNCGVNSDGATRICAWWSQLNNFFLQKTRWSWNSAMFILFCQLTGK